MPVDLSVVRVALRAEAGGHAVPEEKIRGRHARLWPIVASAVAMADHAIYYDSSATRPRAMARFAGGARLIKDDVPAWAAPLLPPWQGSSDAP